MSGEYTVELQIFVEAGCHMCEHALCLAQEVDNEYPQLAVRVVDVGDEPSGRHEDVFAVPTFVLDGRILSLGNPQPGHLRQEIESLLRGRGLV